MPAWADQTLLERDEPLAELTAAVAAHTGSMILLGGPAGIGKTALVRRVARQHEPVWLGACDPWRTPLRPLLDMAPEIVIGSPEDVPAAVLDRLSTVDGPRLAVFEDVHRADQATLDLLRFLGRGVDRLRAAVVATFGDEEVPRPLAVLLDDLATAPGVRRLTLAPLSFEATAALVGTSMSSPARVFQRTGGNPLFINAVLAAGDAEATVRDAVQAALSRVAPDTRAALEAAALVGPRMDSAVLATVLHRLRIPRWTMRDAVFTGLLRWWDHLLEFRHELVAAAIAEAIEPSRRQRLHEAIFLALQRILVRPEHTAELLAHAEAAGRNADVLELAPRAAEWAARFDVHRESAATYDATSQREFWAGNAAAATESADRALAVADSLGDHEAAVSARISQAGARLLGGDLDAIEDLRPHVTSARALLYLGWLPIMHRHYAGLEPLLEQGLAATTRRGLTYWAQLIAGARVTFLLDQGRWDEVEAPAQALLDRADSLTLAVMQAQAALCRLRARRGEPDDQLLDALRDNAKRHRKADAFSLAAPAMAEAAWLAGDPERVRGETLAALKRGELIEHEWWFGELAYWCHRVGGPPLTGGPIAEPYRLAIAGDWRSAAAWWKDRGCAYEAAIALSEGDDPDALRAAVETLDALGARAPAGLVRRRLRELGVTDVPRP